jgi:hypothetical protein
MFIQSAGFIAPPSVAAEPLIIVPEADNLVVEAMPVEALVKTDERTVLSYLSKPMQDQIMRAFRRSDCRDNDSAQNEIVGGLPHVGNPPEGSKAENEKPRS